MMLVLNILKAGIKVEDMLNKEWVFYESVSLRGRINVDENLSLPIFLISWISGISDFAIMLLMRVVRNTFSLLFEYTYTSYEPRSRRPYRNMELVFALLAQRKALSVLAVLLSEFWFAPVGTGALAHFSGIIHLWSFLFSSRCRECFWTRSHPYPYRLRLRSGMIQGFLSGLSSWLSKNMLLCTVSPLIVFPPALLL